MPLTVEASLNAAQFSKYMTLVRRMLDQVENVRSKALRDIDRMKDESASLDVRAGKLTGSSESTDPALQRMERVSCKATIK